jgi:hypothetical protein
LRTSSYRRLRKATLSFTTSEQGTVQVTFTRLVEGRRSRGGCARPTPRNRKRVRCVRGRVEEATFRDIPGYFAQGGLVRFVDLLWDRHLPPGRYEIALSETDRAGLTSPSDSVRVRLAR